MFQITENWAVLSMARAWRKRGAACAALSGGLRFCFFFFFFSFFSLLPLPFGLSDTWSSSLVHSFSPSLLLSCSTLFFSCLPAFAGVPFLLLPAAPGLALLSLSTCSSRLTTCAFKVSFSPTRSSAMAICFVSSSLALLNFLLYFSKSSFRALSLFLAFSLTSRVILALSSSLSTSSDLIFSRSSEIFVRRSFSARLEADRRLRWRSRVAEIWAKLASPWVMAKAGGEEDDESEPESEPRES
mmetsp:Transcript_8535/g.17668  ORF Transcript_8535/g.17668 Transcript_8535/m.17668 type:complete len:242 (+) Transcript_8535:229-954(+)